MYVGTRQFTRKGPSVVRSLSSDFSSITLGNARLSCRLLPSDRSAIRQVFSRSDSLMENILTLSQNGALYFAHADCETTKRRAALFRRFAAAAALQPPDINRRTFADSHFTRKFHPDNGR